MSDLAEQARPAPLLRALPVSLTVLGLALGTWLVGHTGFREVWQAMASVGWSGFLLVGLAQGGLFVILGAGWAAILPGPRIRRLPQMIWARTVRDSAGVLLPFSHIGGFVAGARAVAMLGLSWPVAVATTCTDVTSEFLAQLAFGVIGLGVLLRLAPDAGVIDPLAAGLGATLALCCLAVMLLRGVRPTFRFLAGRIAGPWLIRVSDQADQTQASIDHVQRNRGRLVVGFLLHLAAWFGTAGAGYLTFHLLGAEVSYPKVLVIEAVLHTTMTLTFMVPGALGVQEMAYAGLGTLFGCPPEVAIAVSLLRRARDVAIGVPVLLGWQMLEARRLR